MSKYFCDSREYFLDPETEVKRVQTQKPDLPVQIDIFKDGIKSDKYRKREAYSKILGYVKK